jgi:hypothetical protein
MKKQSAKSNLSRSSSKSMPSLSAGRHGAKRPGKTSSVIPEVLLGGTGIAIISAAAVGVLGFFAWKNREKIVSFIGNYVDLPESWQSDEDASSDYETDSDLGSIASHTSTYTSPSTEQRM